MLALLLLALDLLLLLLLALLLLALLLLLLLALLFLNHGPQETTQQTRRIVGSRGCPDRKRRADPGNENTAKQIPHQTSPPFDDG
ncbi:hypothetical protein [Paracoccus halophilus]|uniref:hypothetical protein n=1 Tax=Paracoccus halophilus TaxID=376733 RepID=UPI0015873129|nr:hypothetical protein [Paracoccus halophilus]